MRGAVKRIHIHGLRHCVSKIIQVPIHLVIQHIRNDILRLSNSGLITKRNAQYSLYAQASRKQMLFIIAAVEPIVQTPQQNICVLISGKPRRNKPLRVHHAAVIFTFIHRYIRVIRSQKQAVIPFFRLRQAIAAFLAAFHRRAQQLFHSLAQLFILRKPKRISAAASIRPSFALGKFSIHTES